jgi:LMBR1 domain-containing protein 1
MLLRMQVTSDMLKRQEREAGRSRQWRGNFKALQRQLLQLEEDESLLDSVFPQACSDEHAMCRVL